MKKRVSRKQRKIAADWKRIARGFREGKSCRFGLGLCFALRKVPGIKHRGDMHSRLREELIARNKCWQFLWRTFGPKSQFKRAELAERFAKEALEV